MKTLQEFIDLLKALVEQATLAKTIKWLKAYIQLLEGLSEKELTTAQKESIQVKLNELIDAKEIRITNYKYLKKSYYSFTSFLQKKYGFVSKGYNTGLYMSLGLSLGMSFGMIIGIPFDVTNGITFGLLFGMLFGMTIGIILGNLQDGIAQKENRVLNN
ncbi:MAG: hypothetical protein ABNH00_11225 [Dokdonia sp.]|jgi:hypothetical protein